MLGIELLNTDAGLTRVRCASKMKLQARKAVQKMDIDRSDLDVFFQDLRGNSVVLDLVCAFHKMENRGRILELDLKRASEPRMSGELVSFGERAGPEAAKRLVALGIGGEGIVEVALRLWDAIVLEIEGAKIGANLVGIRLDFHCLAVMAFRLFQVVQAAPAIT